MAAREPVTIVLGPESFVIRPLTIDQVERLEATVQASNIEAAALAETSSPAPQVPLARKIIAIGLSRDNASVDLADSEADVADLMLAMVAVLRHGGFLPAATGEARAAAPTSA